MKHLETEELLLLADGELSAGRAAHFDGCVECQERLGALQGELTAISSALTVSDAEGDDAEASWHRLEEAMSRTAVSGDFHLSPEELLLLVDGELSHERAEHSKRCAGCGSAHLDMRQMLWGVETELRALAPSEPLERRLAAERALKQHLYPEPKVLVFPTRTTARYAAAAAALISFTAGAWLWNQPTVTPEPTVATVAPAETATPTPLTVAEAVADAPALIAQPAERFVLATARAESPSQEPIAAPAAPALGFEPTRVAVTWASLPRVTAPAAVETVLVAEATQTPATPSAFAAFETGETAPAGGLVRNALVEHYRDAARRSFRTLDSTGIDSEIRRYVSDVFANQKDLVSHVYQIRQLVADLEQQPAGDDGHKALTRQVRTQVSEARSSEGVIYDRLSEALPRRYWRYRGETALLGETSGLREESQALLDDVLTLERTLTSVLTGSQRTVSLDAADASTGLLLERIHDRLDRVRQLARAL